MSIDRTDIPRHPIRVVSRRTGLTPALLRAWERRYGVVTPSRSEGGQRLYSDDDVRRLGLLHQVVEEGRSISQVAGFSTEELMDLVAEDQVERLGPPAPEPLEAVSAKALLQEAQAAVEGMDPLHLERLLTRAALAMPVHTLIDEVLTPLLEGIGSAWERGELGPAHEHIASVVIRRFLEWLLDKIASGESAPVLVSGTPSKERHELGALLSAVSAAGEGWTARYLGPDLPAEDIAAAARRLGARIVALSVVDPALGAVFPEEIRSLKNYLGSGIDLIVGGPEKLIAPMAADMPDVAFMSNRRQFRESLRRNLRQFG